MESASRWRWAQGETRFKVHFCGDRRPSPPHLSRQKISGEPRSSTPARNATRKDPVPVFLRLFSPRHIPHANSVTGTSGCSQYTRLDQHWQKTDLNESDTLITNQRRRQQPATLSSRGGHRRYTPHMHSQSPKRPSKFNDPTPLTDDNQTKSNTSPNTWSR